MRTVFIAIALVGSVLSACSLYFGDPTHEQHAPGVTAPDAISGGNDAGSCCDLPDAGIGCNDGGTAWPDAGWPPPDAVWPPSDAGWPDAVWPPVDAVTLPPDAVSVPPDAGWPTPDAAY